MRVVKCSHQRRSVPIVATLFQGDHNQSSGQLIRDKEPCLAVFVPDDGEILVIGALSPSILIDYPNGKRTETLARVEYCPEPLYHYHLVFQSEDQLDG